MAKSPEKRIAKFEENLRPWIGSKNPPPFVDKDIVAFERFVIEHCRTASAETSPVVRRALLLLHEMRDWEFRRWLKHPSRPEIVGGVRFSKDGCPYLYYHHATSEDEGATADTPYLISGGAFEMNRRRH
jgi:hypothetical protein